MILTTGRAFPAGNTVNESNIRPGYLNGHPFNIDNDGDSDLEAALDISWSQDATYIKFNFTPQGETISFRFLMASDEYDGRYECYFADGFAFLLREEGTSTYTNLAVLPDGITPVSITNINQASLITHDPNDPDPLPDIPCDANIEFFEGYNLDHTNYGGRTVVLTATSTVTPGAQYEIKLVVADQSDSIFDSAIFIEGGSFIIDGDLGPDRLIVNGNPGCQGTDITLDTNLSVARATFEWFKDGVIISGETNSTLLVSTGGTYSFKATSGANCETTDEVVIEFALPEIISPPVDILICETDGNGKEEFDFSVNKTLVLGNQSAVNYPITYHKSQAKAESNTDPLPEAYENSSVTETIWLRIANLTQSCYEVISFDIEVRTQPIANTPIDYNLCDDSDDGDDANGISTFNLSSKMSEVLGSQSNLDYTVKFYKNQPLAEAGVDNTEITSPIQNTTNPQSIFARIENKLNVDCFSTTSFQLIVNPLPEIISPPVDILICETDGNGKEEFDFSVNKTLVLGNQSAVNYPITYHESQAKAESNTDPLPEAYENSSVTETIWLRIANLTQSCYEVISFDIEVRTQPIANTPIDYNLCDDSDDGDDANGISTFNLSSKMSEVLGSQSNLDYTVKFYKNQPLAEAGVDNTEITSPIQNTTNPQSIFARIENKLNVDCFSTTSFQLIVNPLPEIISPPVDILICETDGNGKEEFDFSVNKTLVLGNQSAVNYPITYHESQAKAESNTDPLPEAYENSSVTETIWLRIADLTQSCYEVISFDIEVRQPIANTPIDYNLCDDSDDGDDANGISTFNLSSKMSEVLGSQSNLDYTVKFYKNQPLAEAGVDNTEITSPIQNTTNPQSIFARIENKLNVDCFSTTSFQLIVNPLPVVKSEVTLKQCDSDTDGITDFNLTEANQLISTDYTNETFSYYLTQVQSEMGLVADQISTPTIYTNPIPVNSVVYARVETTHGCFRTSKVNLAVGATLLDPATFQLEYFVCDDTEVDNDNTNGVAAFDFSDATAKVLAQLPTNQNLTVSYYISEADALAETNSIADITKHRNTENPTTQNIYARVDSNDVNACLGLGHHITLNVDPLPNRNTITDYVLCSDTTQTTFDLTTKDAELIGSQTIPILISYHLSEQHAINNTPIPNPSTYPNTSNPQTIYVRAQFDPDNNMNLDVRECVRTDISFELQVNLNPVLTTPDPIIECNDQVTTLYDLTIRKDQITNNDTSIALTYFETQQDLAANTPIATPTTYTNNTLTKTILVLATGSNQCTKTITLDLTTVLYANINKTPTPIEECEIDNNGFDYFDLTLRETEILNGLNPSEFEISYYEDHTDAISGNTNNIADPTNFENTIVLTQKIYVRVKSKLNPCYFIVPLTIIVNPVPEIDILDRYVICLNKADQVINPVTQSFLPIPPIDTQLSTAIYSFQWYKGSIEEVDFDPTSFIIPGATSSTFSPSSEGTYTVLATNLASGCRIPASTEVVSSYPPESIDVTLLSPVFSDNNRLEVVVVGTGEYEYRVDFGPWQRGNSI